MSFQVRDQREEDYAKVSRDLCRADGPKLSVYAKAVYLVLATHAGQKQKCYPGKGRIAEMAGCSKRKVYDAVQELVEAGWISVRGAIDKESGRRTSNIYTLLENPHRNGGTMHEVPGDHARDAGGTMHSVPGDHARDAQQEVASNEVAPKEVERARTHAREAPEQPSLEEVKQYASMNGIPEQLAEKFFYHYESEGWETRHGKVMRWQPRLQKWKVEQHKYATNGSTPAARGTMKQL